jgi:hypothetical protein
MKWQEISFDFASGIGRGFSPGIQGRKIKGL